MPARCVNCGTERGDLIEHEGDLWCPETADCDLALYHQRLGGEIEESERHAQERARADSEPTRVAMVDPFGGVTITWEWIAI